MTDPRPLDYRNAQADPRPVVPYLDPALAHRRRPPGDQMAFGFGCLTSALLVVPGAVVLASIGVSVSRSQPATWPIAAAAIAVVGQVVIGLLLGLRGNRWGYLQGVGWSVVMLAVVVGIIRLLMW